MKNTYQSILPIESAIAADRQSAKRHYGVHPYFTRRPHNVVRRYVLHYTREGDTVLDPFGGSGVTAVEAFLENRIGVQNDINPLANFIAAGIANLHRGSLPDYEAALRATKEKCYRRLDALNDMSAEQLEEAKEKAELPANIPLPSTSDVAKYYDLFSPRQLLALAILREAIETISEAHARDALLLAWSATLAKLNRTFLSAEGRIESRGGSSIFSIYRYKIAKHPVELPPWKTFEERARNVLLAKKEIDRSIELKCRTGGWQGQFEIHALDIDELSRRFEGRADYIFTDPPYGGHISYIDLSVMWNAWLDMLPTTNIRQRELIVGGELNIPETAYTERLGQSIDACIRMLKPGRWCSVVFQHWNTDYFDAILTSAAESGADLKAAVPQVGNTVWSMHKKKGNESVLAGELILTFYKTGKQKTVRAPQSQFDVEQTISRILSEAHEPFLYGEHVFNQLIIAAWKKGAIRRLDVTKDEFNELIRRHGWQYQEQNHRWVRGHSNRLLFA